MSKFTDAVKAALKAYFETGDQPTESQFAEVFDRIQQGIQEHEHKASGGAGSGTGDAGLIDYTSIIIKVFNWIGVSAADWHLADPAPKPVVFGIFPALDFAPDRYQYCFYSLLIPYKMAEDTRIQVHVDWCYDGSHDDGTVCWKLDYHAVGPGDVVNDITGTLTEVTEGRHIERQLVRTTFRQEIEKVKPGHALALRLWRDYREDTLRTEAKMLQVHFRILVDKLGQPVS